VRINSTSFFLSAYRSLYAILLLILLPIAVLSQKQIETIYPVTDCPRSEKQADIWYFGDKAGIDFRSGTAVPLTDENVMTAFKSSAVISDSLFHQCENCLGKRFHPHVEYPEHAWRPGCDTALHHYSETR